MTYKQLFDTIPFDDLVPFLPKDWQNKLVASCPPDVNFSDWIFEDDHFDPIESAKWKAWRSKRRQELGLVGD